MPDNEVKWTKTTVRFLKKMKSVGVENILKNMMIISKNPFHYIKRLRGVPLYSLRTEKYRVIMSVERKKLVTFVIEVGNRKNVYDDL
ncbi:MAG: type II toxin-antitoxin system RelE/ParE family toxin [Candidatus Thermoplasmatota archaeon]|nr:type II toxin-antitoxin system RelE/ParE family toxin [Candidatus Thermoplasmatota archaeon]